MQLLPTPRTAARPTPGPLRTLLVLLPGLLGLGCTSDRPPLLELQAPAIGSAQPATLAEEGSALPAPTLADADVVAHAGTVRVDAAAVLRTAQVRNLLAHLYGDPIPLTPGWALEPRAVEDVAQQALLDALLLQESRGRGLTVSDADIDAELALAPNLARLAAMPAFERDAVLADFAPLQWDDLRYVAQMRVLHQRWLDAAATTLDDATLLEMYEALADQMNLEVVLVPNRPDAQAIRRVVEEEPEAIETWYREHRGWYQLPRNARVERWFIAVPADVGPDATTEATQRLTLARERMLAGGDPPTDLVFETGWIEERNFPEAFNVDIGSLTPIVDVQLGSPQQPGLAFARVLERQPARVAPLDDNLRIQIAAQILQRTRVQPEPMAQARAIEAAWRSGDTAAFEAALAAAELTVRTTGLFPRASRGSIPLLGEVPQVHTSLFYLLQQPGDRPREPFLTPEGIAVVRLLERQHPDRAEFERRRASFRAEVEPGFRAQAWGAFTTQWFIDHPPQVDVARIQAEAAALGLDAVAPTDGSAARPAEGAALASPEGSSASPATPSPVRPPGVTPP